MPRLGIPIISAYVTYLVINPFVPMLMKVGINRGSAIAIVFVGFLFLSIYPIVKIVPAVTKEAEKVQTYIPKIETYLKQSYRDLRKTVKNKTGYEIGAEFPIEILKIGTQTSKSVIMKIPKYIGSLLEWALVVPLFIFFLLKDARTFRNFILEVTPNSIFERFYYVYFQFNKKLGDYIFAKVFEASIVGTIITSGLLILDVKFAFLLGLIAIITNIIPYVGPFLGAIPALLFGIAEYGFTTTFWGIFILYMVANIFDLALVFPILVSKIVDLHPIIVVISVIVGSQLFGLLGMVISIPLAAALKLILVEVFDEIYQTRRI